MPAKGKHRRPKNQRFTRSIAIAGTGGAALALPLMGAAGAHAATPQSAPEKAVQSAPAAEKKAAEKATGVRTYTVRAGDYLAKIADEQNVDGGWKKLYADNRDAVGDDPSLIHPGLKLSIGKKAAASESKSSAPAKPSASKSSASESSSKPAAAKPAAAASSGFTLPVEGATVGTPYHMSGSMWSSGYHTGVDFVVPTGTSLKAVGAGTVVSAGWGGAYGNQVVIKLNDGFYAQYAHLSQLSVSAGQTVTAGQQIGLSGATGNVTGPHLHFEIRTTPDYGSDVDPVAYLRSHGVSVG
ncbi:MULTISPECIES: M23 family metallopeptidase [Streptomyces]|uniref:Glycyl-glycine endopeptidase ALE-1 n=1 Tax=Streptomyces chartreusis NRRL 3882 TaxID=1079985 RepID=A0A2N9B2Q2_STRCX|nr:MULTISPECIES: LysM peptidoglycan-binding domain-containing M23 family metallopeptidase [Streptomyces]MYS93038.1 peptidoglycan DD-metalloendopeptidase family protein [Streptomyces sp. SID5464]SOR77606.1 Glycyl-glycine endopeptidase ALE-1 precursor [Streptomyces chartreusis NRRL 3882]